MVNKGPNWFGVVAMCAIYWGALYYWVRDELSAGGDDQSRALIPVSYTHLRAHET